jgi:RND superfamily putative drug exporter
MAGMFLTGNATFSSFAVGTMIVVAVAMVGSVTFLPAMLAVLGDRIELGRIPRLGRRRGPRARPRLSTAVARSALRRPLRSALVAAIVLAGLAVPAFGLQTLVPGAQSVPASLPVMKTYARIQAAFPGDPAPAQVVVSGANVGAPAVRTAIARLERSALATGQIGQPMSVSVNSAGTVAVVSMPLAGGGTDATSNRALVTLREQLIPRAFERLGAVRVQVTGETAQSKDFNDLLAARTPLVFAFVLGLAFLLLLVTFRSLTIPVTAIALTLLSVGAAYGVLVLVFQHRWAEGLLGFHSIGGITSWLPLFLFIVLFGLSMDYHVFILSRIKEARDGGMSTRDAVAHGLATTAGVVNSAAIVMAAVFAIFATLSSLEFKQLGVGLAAAVLIDATLIRCVLLPAVMTLLGEANWYLPRWMRRPLAAERARARPQPVAAPHAASRRPGAVAQAAVVVEGVESAP